jgi:cystathionine gamma-synthase
MKDWRKVRVETLAVHAGHEIDPATGAVVAPIHLSTTFERDVEGNYPRGFMYTRNDNPNRKALEEAVSALEGGAAAAAFGSGMAAAMGLLAALAPGDHVLAHVDAYYGTSRLLRDLFLRWKLEADFADLSDLPAVKKALRPNTKLVWMETPSNPLLKIVDLAAVATIGREAGAVCICDNTWAPVIQRPFDAGADFILHSTTKYFGGHCDVLGGIIVAKRDDEFFQGVRSIQSSAGGCGRTAKMRLKWRSFSRKIKMLSACITRALNRIPVTTLPNDRCRCSAECFRLKQRAGEKRRCKSPRRRKSSRGRPVWAEWKA